MVSFVTSLLVLGVLIALVIPFGKRRPVGAPLTWGEAMLASTYTFFLFFWAYGVVPHYWLTWADNELKWRPDKLVYGPAGIFEPQALGGSFPFTLNYQVLRDLIAVGIYVAFLAVNIWAFAWWNDRQKKAEAAERELVTSDYGRPLVRKG